MQNLDHTDENLDHTDENLDHTDDAKEYAYAKEFQTTQQIDTNTGTCIPKYNNYTPTINKNAPAWQIINNPALSTSLFTVKGSDGADYTLSAAWISGFTDGEGTLTFYLNSNKELAGGLQVQSAFVIVQGESDYYLLTAIANFFGCGSVTVNRKDKTSVRYQFRVVDSEILKELIIPFFQVSPLCTKKGKEYQLWSKWTMFFANKKHKKDWPTGMIELLEGLKTLKLLGYRTKQAEDFIKSCDKYIEAVKNSKPPRS